MARVSPNGELVSQAGDQPAAGLLVIAEQALVREGLASCLRSQGGFARVEVAAPSEACEVLSSWHPCLVLADIAVASHTDLVSRATSIGARVVAFGLSEADENEVLVCAEFGVAGYIDWDASLEDLRAALLTALRGGLHCSARVADVVCRRLRAFARATAQGTLRSELTGRERQIVELMREGLSNKEIAARLCIATATVKNHVHSLLGKLGVRRRALAVAATRSSKHWPRLDTQIG
jgi:DNA-binding NarL/FixJ family response regulator